MINVPITPEIQNLIDRGAVFVANHIGGKTPKPCSSRSLASSRRRSWSLSMQTLARSNGMEP